MNIKELLTKQHLGKRVITQSIKYGTISSGIFQGVTKSAHDGGQVFSFTDGVIGDTLQTVFAFPVARMAEEILVGVENR